MLEPFSHKLIGVLLAGLAAGGVGSAATGSAQEKSLNVTATAYTSTESQTDSDPLIGAWGHRLDRIKDVRVIAVSPDLLQKGLKRGQRVRIKGLKGEFVVMDKMSSRWNNRIDLYMGHDLRAAKLWGKRRVKMIWKEQ